MKKRLALSGLMLAINGFGYACSHAQSLTVPKSASPLSSLLPNSTTKTTPAAAIAKNKSTIEVRALVVKLNEFPPVISGQIKVAFECTILHAPPQTDFDVFPRYRCDLDKPRTVEMNRLTIQRVDQFPSVDGITTKIVIVAHNSSKDTAIPSRLRAAFQLYRDQSVSNSVAMLKEFCMLTPRFRELSFPVAQPT